MGEVYKAKDTRLDRQVAIKVLPAAFAQDADRLSRFEREVKAVAALSHPNILSIFDFGVHDGLAYAVMELLDGETLRERLARGALTVRKATECAIQIAKDFQTIRRPAPPIIPRELFERLQRCW